MGRASRRKRDWTARRVSPKAKSLRVEESFTAGPFEFRRAGRFIEMTSKWPEGGHEAMKERARGERPEMLEKAQQAARSALDLLRRCDPIHLVGHIFLKNAVLDPEHYVESSYEGKEAHIEYAQSLALCVDSPGSAPPSHAELEQFAAAINEVFEQTHWYYHFEFTDERREDWEYQVRFLPIMRVLKVRGSSIHEHQRELFLELYSEHDDWLKRNVGLTAAELLAAADAIDAQVTDALRDSITGCAVGMRLHEQFREFVSEYDPNEARTVQDLFAAFNERVDPSVRSAMSHIFDNPFRIAASPAVPAALLDRLSAGFGDNSSFAENQHSPMSPLGDSIIYTKPLLNLHGEHFCVNPVLLARKLDRIVENWISEDSHYFKNGFATKRGKFVERKAREYFDKLLPGAQIHPNLYYFIVDESGLTKRVETDAIVLWDRFAFVVESKAGGVDLPARRGGLDGLRDDLKKIVGKGFEQALRTRSYIESADSVSFENDAGARVLTLQAKNYDRVFLINVTLEPLGFLGSQLGMLRDMGVLPGGEWPWSVFLNDLRIVTELLETGSDFVAMLESRIRAHDLPQFFAADEIDILMMYLDEGVDLTEMSLAGGDLFQPHGYTDALDRYYAHAAGSVSSGPKPQSKFPALFRSVVEQIESLAHPGFSRVSLLLLKSSKAAIQKLAKAVDERVSHTRRAGQSHETIVQSGDRRTVIAISSARSWSAEDLSAERSSIPLRMYDYRASRWVSIYLRVEAEACRVIDYADVETEWVANPVVDQEIRQRKLASVREYIQHFGEPDRNKLCPCRSGKKFKVCCRKLL